MPAAAPDPCSCPLAGHCERHRRQKTAHTHNLCQTRADYRKKWDQQAGRMPEPPPRPPVGVGSELKSFLSWFGYKSNGHCRCDERAAAMDANGIEWCEANFDLLIDQLRESAAEMQVTFLKSAARFALRRAIKRAKRNRARHAARAATTH